VQREATSERPAKMWPLYFGLFGGHVAWSLQLMLGYFFVWLFCVTDSFLFWLLVHVVTLVALVVTGAAGWFAYRAWRRIEDELHAVTGRPYAMGDVGEEGSARYTSSPSLLTGDTEEGESGETTTPRASSQRTRFLAISGIGLSGIYVFVILLGGISVFVVSPCA
jgi:hypothetical protein